MFNKIVVPLDGSVLAEKALPYAAQLARIFEAEIVLLRGAVAHVYWGDIPPEDSWEVAQEATEYLKVVKALLTDPVIAPSLPPEKVSFRVVDSDTPVALAETAREAMADLIVMTTHGRSGISRLFMGSTAMGVLHATNLPIVLIHPQEQHFDYASEANLTNILVTLDGTTGAEAILESVSEFAKVARATLTLLRVVAPVYYPSPGIFSPHAYYPPELIDQEINERELEVKQYLAKIQGELTQKGISSRIAVEIGLTTENILNYIAHNKPQMIAMATHARNYLGRLVLGSVADELIRKTNLPVLLVHTQKGSEQTTEEKSVALKV
jgi:nucleotide-binding universal stress UspA family protein